MRTLSFVVFFCLAHLNHAQELVSSAGAYHKGNNFNLHWSVGELIVDTYVGSGFVLSKGFHQGLLPGASGTMDFVPFDLEIFPNPCFDYLNIKTNTNIDFECFVFDHLGRVVKSTYIHSPLLNVSDLIPGMYYLVLKKSNNINPPLKFIKI
jgi:hypothetical protein